MNCIRLSLSNESPVGFNAVLSNIPETNLQIFNDSEIKSSVTGNKQPPKET